MRLLPLLLAAGCLAHADTPATPFECTTFPVRQTTTITAFQAPADLTNAKVNATKLPAGWEPVGGTIGEGGAYVLACRPAPLSG